MEITSIGSTHNIALKGDHLQSTELIRERYIDLDQWTVPPTVASRKTSGEHIPFRFAAENGRR